MSNKPLKTIKLGFCEAAIWEKDGRFAATIKKRYKTKDGEYKDTTSFAADDCAIVSVLAAQAAQYMSLAKEKLKTASHGAPLPGFSNSEVPAPSFGDDDVPF